MPILSEDQLKARNCLKVGDVLIDPKHLHPREAAEAKLRERCRACWSLRAFWPDWVCAYAEKWKAEKKPVLTKDEEDWAA